MQEGKAYELIDACMGEYSQYEIEVLRCIHVSLLCVQQRPADRPSMSSVVLMLGSEGALVQPKPPGYYTEADHHLAEADSTSRKQASSSINETTISVMEAR